MEDIDILEDRDVIESRVEETVSPTDISNVIHEATIEEVKNELSTLDTESSTDDSTEEDGDKITENADLILEAHISDTLDTDKVASEDGADGDDASSSDEETAGEAEGEDCPPVSAEPRPTYAQALQAETGRWTALCETSPMSSSQETELQVKWRLLNNDSEEN